MIQIQEQTFMNTTFWCENGCDYGWNTSKTGDFTGEISPL